jgi:hypothetical protein
VNVRSTASSQPKKFYADTTNHTTSMFRSVPFSVLKADRSSGGPALRPTHRPLGHLSLAAVLSAGVKSISPEIHLAALFRLVRNSHYAILAAFTGGPYGRIASISSK